MTINVVSFLSTALNWGKAAIGFALPVVSGPLGWALGFLDTLWNSQMGRIVIVAAGVFVGTWFWCWTSEHSKIAAAIQARDAYYLQQISKVNAAADKRILEANDAARKVTATPPAGPELLRLCLNSPDCRKARK